MTHDPKKYHVYEIATISRYVGEYEANSPKEAEEKASADGEATFMLCHECARKYDAGDVYEVQVEEIK